jgi:hypothetical protein
MTDQQEDHEIEATLETIDGTLTITAACAGNTLTLVSPAGADVDAAEALVLHFGQVVDACVAKAAEQEAGA